MELVWDEVGERRFETGIDRGVLFPPSGPAVPWNGLTSVTEVLTREVKSYYIDGIKYLDHHVPGSYAAKLQAFTYPDELEKLLGTTEFAPGVFLHDQGRVRLFNLSYRTRVGNDVDGIDHGYKVHILYNILATPSDQTFDSLGENLEPEPFEWNLTGTPPLMFGVRPTCHVSLDSRSIAPAMLDDLEELIYGTPLVDPNLPSFVDLMAMVDA